MTDSQVKDLGERCGAMAMRGAVRYFIAQGFDPGKLTEVQAGRFAVYVADAVKAALPGALDDFHAAADCNMTEVGTVTFSASMALAGVSAAKRVLAEI